MMLTKQRPIHILQVVGGMNRGGIETWLMNVLQNIDRDRFQIDFLVHTTQPCAYDDEVRALGSKIIPCPYLSQPWLYARNFKRILREHGPYDIVHSQVYLFDGFVLRLADQKKVPVKISHIHPLTDIKEKQFLRPIYQWFMTRWIAEYATHILSPSKNSSESFRKICDCSGKHTEILYNGVKLNHFAKEVDRIAIRQKFAIPIDKPVVIYVARLTAHKNHLQMLRIAEQINRDKLQVSFVMVGSHGELMETIKEKIHHRNDISLLTGVEDISELLLAADLFFFPSLEEGFGVVAIEAAAAGLPIVATNLPTIREAISPSHHAFMFPPNNDEVACANILKILNNEYLRNKLSCESKEWAVNFSITKSIQQLISLYSTCQ
ncbi:glycosyltransferase [Scytonema sp. PCC 10023]|uniref:glycosyltransferase n=1 Tax=Scytonema sp. PCC 10023 TaxID=1680591 RepID=UPI0039C60663